MRSRLQRILLVAIGVLLAGPAAAEWRRYDNPEFGYRIEYPRDLFQLPERDDTQGGITLTSTDGAARLYVFGGRNQSGESPGSLAQGLGSLDDVHQVTYRRIAPDWFVLSGYLVGSGDIFYERIEVSRDRRHLSGFRLEYPVDQRWKFDSLIGRIGRSLTPPGG